MAKNRESSHKIVQIFLPQKFSLFDACMQISCCCCLLVHTSSSRTTFPTQMITIQINFGSIVVGFRLPCQPARCTLKLNTVFLSDKQTGKHRRHRRKCFEPIFNRVSVQTYNAQKVDSIPPIQLNCHRRCTQAGEELAQCKYVRISLDDPASLCCIAPISRRRSLA